MTPTRDPTTGRFLKPSVEERVTAHVEKVNALHPKIYPLFSFEIVDKDRDAWEKRRDAGLAKIDASLAAFDQTPRAIPIEYDKPGNFLTDNWLWLTPIALALVGLVVYLVR